MIFKPGQRVRLIEPFNGVPAGATGVLIQSFPPFETLLHVEWDYPYGCSRGHYFSYRFALVDESPFTQSVRAYISTELSRC